MGIFFVLLFWLFLGLIVAGFGAVILAGATWLLTRGVKRGRKRLIIVAALVPFAGLAWCGGIFIFQAVVNAAFLDRDIGIGDSWQTPLPNGYRLEMIDDVDKGYVYKPGPNGDSSFTDDTGVPDVTLLQISGSYMLGRFTDDLGPKPAPPAQYFLLDARTDKRRTFNDMAGLRAAAAPLGIKPALEPIENIYDIYRPTWFDGFALFLFALFPLTALFLLALWVRRLRKTRIPAIA